jgi:predicted Zn-dependent protease with MMP-like domain
MRGPLAPPEVPLSRSRSERFDQLVLDAVERLDDSWGEQLKAVEFAVEDVPPGENPAATTTAERVPLGRVFPQTRDQPPRIVVYRRPLEARAGEDPDLAALVHDVVVEQVAELLGLEPGNVDPGYRGEDS